jgi:hypothetical protein
MCQQWISIVGLCLDVIGFLMIAFEWRHTFKREYERRMGELDRDYDKYSAETAGVTYQDPSAGDYTMAKLFSKLFRKEWLFRGELFATGVTLVIFGFIGQVLGSWPGGIWHFHSC